MFSVVCWQKSTVSSQVGFLVTRFRVCPGQ